MPSAFEALRGFDPGELRDDSGKWTLGGAIVHAIVKGSNGDNLHVAGHGNGEVSITHPEGHSVRLGNRNQYDLQNGINDAPDLFYGKANHEFRISTQSINDNGTVNAEHKLLVRRIHERGWDQTPEGDEAYQGDRYHVHIATHPNMTKEELRQAPHVELTHAQLDKLTEKINEVGTAQRFGNHEGAVHVFHDGRRYVIEASSGAKLSLTGSDTAKLYDRLSELVDEVDTSPHGEARKDITLKSGGYTLRGTAHGTYTIEPHDRDETISLSEADMSEFLRTLEDLGNLVARSTAGSNAPAGGEFALGGGRVTGHGKQAPKPKPHAPAKPTGPRRFGYNAKTNKGIGYGIQGGDPSVRILQADMNRLGLADAHGNGLTVDGRYGPKTTAMVKLLQKALKLDQSGQVDQNLINAVSAMKALPGISPMAHKPPAHKASAHHHGHHAHKAHKATHHAHHASATHHKRRRVHRSESGGDMPSGTATNRGPMLYDRSFPLDDIQISRSGDGRTVEAYAAIFGQPYEVHDQHGHYMELIDRSAFNRTLSGGAGKQAMCLYNHGMTVHGTADALSSVPLGTPLEIKADTRGLLTVTRYNRSALADSVLESIRNGDIRAQSFRGRIVRSSPNGVPRASRGAALPTITRHELGLTDYGPTPVPVNAGAEIMAVRSITELVEDFQSLDADEREELLRALDIELPTLDGGPGNDDEDCDECETATASHDALGAEESTRSRHSGRLLIARAALTATLRLKGVINA